MTIENTVSSDFLSALVDCLESFQLAPNRCGISCHTPTNTIHADGFFFSQNIYAISMVYVVNQQ